MNLDARRRRGLWPKCTSSTFRKQTEPATTVLHAREGNGTHRFLTLLIPLKIGGSNPVVKVSGESPANVEFKDGRKLEITVEKDGGIKVRETLADGKIGREVK